ncbi:plasmid mobilization protein [Pontiella desulfatans]
MLPVRFTEAEKAKIQQDAKDSGLSLTEYVRRKLL